VGNNSSVDEIRAAQVANRSGCKRSLMHKNANTQQVFD
jgi:hypothetical protein